MASTQVPCVQFTYRAADLSDVVWQLLQLSSETPETLLEIFIPNDQHASCFKDDSRAILISAREGC
jgi:hypothetical protein